MVEEIDEIDIPMPEPLSPESGSSETVKPSSKMTLKDLFEGNPIVPTKTYCPMGSPDGSPRSHSDHDERIRELEAFKKAVERTPRVLAERVVRLERAVITLQKRYRKPNGGWL